MVSDYRGGVKTQDIDSMGGSCNQGPAQTKGPKVASNNIPYFRFYPADFMHGVRGMSAQEVGVYIMILCRIYESSGPIECSPLRLSTYCGMRQATFDKVLEKLVDLDKLQMLGGMICSRFVDDARIDARREAARPWIPSMMQREVRARDGHVCAYCGETGGPFHLDHIVPWSRGGAHSIENLTVCCATCNWSKGNKTVSEWAGNT